MIITSKNGGKKYLYANLNIVNVIFNQLQKRVAGPNGLPVQLLVKKVSGREQDCLMTLILTYYIVQTKLNLKSVMML